MSVMDRIFNWVADLSDGGYFAVVVGMFVAVWGALIGSAACILYVAGVGR